MKRQILFSSEVRIGMLLAFSSRNCPSAGNSTSNNASIGIGNAAVDNLDTTSVTITDTLPITGWPLQENKSIICIL